MQTENRALDILNELIASHESIPGIGESKSNKMYDSLQSDAMVMLDTLIFEMETSLANASPELLESLNTQGKGKKKEQKDSKKKAKKAPPPPPPAGVIDVNSLDFRVGKIINVEVHATADKLYCEDIDIGEDGPRKIASGLVPFYSLEEMQGRRLIVVSNLKPKKLVGFMSHGMVLCASSENADGTRRVEFVEPPEDAPVGTRVFAPSVSHAEGLSANQCDKKKAFLTVAPDLCINEEGCMVWQGHLLTCGEHGGPCTAPTLRNCPVA